MAINGWKVRLSCTRGNGHGLGAPIIRGIIYFERQEMYGKRRLKAMAFGKLMYLLGTQGKNMFYFTDVLLVGNVKFIIYSVTNKKWLYGNLSLCFGQDNPSSLKEEVLSSTMLEREVIRSRYITVLYSLTISGLLIFAIILFSVGWKKIYQKYRNYQLIG